MTPEQIISELRFAADTGGADPGMLREAADLIAALMEVNTFRAKEHHK